MARKMLYSDDLLLEAVIKYAAEHHGKLKATEIAAWANEEIPELAGVEARHFIRDIKDENGRLIPRASKVKIDEINEQRSLECSSKSNPILASSPDAFLALSPTIQRRAILEVKDTHRQTRVSNRKLYQENQMLKYELEKANEQLKNVKEVIDATESKSDAIEARQRYIIAYVSEEKRREALESHGIYDNMYDPDVYEKYRKEVAGKTLDIRKTINTLFDFQSPLIIDNAAKEGKETKEETNEEAEDKILDLRSLTRNLWDEDDEEDDSSTFI